MARIKRPLVLICLALLLASALIASAFIVFGTAKEEKEIFSYEKFDYTVLPDGSAKIVDYRGNQREITVPDVICGRIVSVIGESAFYAVNAKKITLGSFVTEIERHAFAGAASLQEIEIDSEITKIGDYAFLECGALLKFDFPDSLTELGIGAFAKAYSLGAVSLPDGVKKIPESCFLGAESLVSVNAPSVTEIGKGAFEKCASLESVTLQSAESVGERAFASSSLKVLNFGASLREIGYKAFYDMQALESIGVSAENPKFAVVDGALIDKVRAELIIMPRNSGVAL